MTVKKKNVSNFATYAFYTSSVKGHFHPKWNFLSISLLKRKSQGKFQFHMFAASSTLVGPPGPPVDCQVTEVTETTASVSWAPGLENYSPILSFTIQARTLFFLGWQAVTTGGSLLSVLVSKYGTSTFSSQEHANITTK